MNTQLKITKIGNSAGVVLLKNVLSHLQLGVGDELTVVATTNGIELRRSDPDFDDQMAVAREVMARRQMAIMVLAHKIMDEDRELLAKLAKL